MAQFDFETKLVENRICHYFHQDKGFKDFVERNENKLSQRKNFS